MPVFISMLRAVNVGAHNKIKMESLRGLYESLGLKDAQTYVQSGNVVFRTGKSEPAALARKIETALERTFGFRPAVILRTAKEMREVVAGNPFALRSDIIPNKLLVTFLATDPGQEARDKLLALKVHPEELRAQGSQLYIYYPDGVGRSKLPVRAIDKALNTPGTARNWTSVLKLLEIAESL